MSLCARQACRTIYTQLRADCTGILEWVDGELKGREPDREVLSLSQCALSTLCSLSLTLLKTKISHAHSLILSHCALSLTVLSLSLCSLSHCALSFTVLSLSLCSLSHCALSHTVLSLTHCALSHTVTSLPLSMYSV